MDRELQCWGGVALIDEEDWPLVSQYRWRVFVTDRRTNRCQSAKAYVSTQRRDGSRPATLYLHRLIMAATPGQTVDHINGNPLDNRRANLRFASQSQQNANQGVPSHNSSGFKGVSWHKHKQKWMACIQVHRQGKTLGYYTTAEEAAHAYDKKAREVFGEFAHVNFPN